MRKWCLFLFVLTILNPALAQQPAPSFPDRLAPHLRSTRPGDKPSNSRAVYWIATNNRDSLRRALGRFPSSFRLLREYTGAGILVVEGPWNLVEGLLLPSPLVTFIDGPRQPREELFQKRFDSHVNNINRAHRDFPTITGRNTVLSIKENRFDTLDIDFKGRIQSTSLAADFTTTHASIMATLAAGAGNTYYTGKGVAFEATLGSASFANLLPEEDTDYLRYGITVQNHSYGTGIENYYGADAAAYDAAVAANRTLVPVFSAGNSGNQAPEQGRYAGIPNRANLTGSFKMAKNILTVGAVDSFYLLETLSSKGPAYDGRIKPELVAFGEDGSSGAAALTSGAALLVQQSYREQHNVNYPEAALTRALLINGADDLETPGPDFNTGFGNLNVAQSLKMISRKSFATGTLNSPTPQVYTIQVPPDCHQLKLTLCWTDPPATANAVKSLVNDLDLVVTTPHTGQVFQPWVLNAYPQADSLNAPALRKKDTLNNVEQVTIDHPEAGTYQFTITAERLKTAAQSFAVAWDIKNHSDWEWKSPVRGDAAIPGQDLILRWHCGSDEVNGQLEYQYAGEAAWHQIGTVALSPGWFKWNTPDTAALVQFRMRVNDQNYLSDTFTLMNVPALKTGLNCRDSLLLYWNSIPGANTYRLYTLGEKYLFPFKEIRDSFAVLGQNEFSAGYFSVAPALPGGPEGYRSISIDYRLQGVGCYFSNFLADLTRQNTVALRFLLGTTYRIGYLEIEKWKGNSFTTIERVDQYTTEVMFYEDQELVKGANIYRIKIVRTDGQVIYSPVETVYYLSNDEFLVFPNPVSRNQGSYSIVSKEYLGHTLQLYDLSGRLVYRRSLQSNITTHPVSNLPPGVYILKILNEGRMAFIRKLLIR